MNCSSSTTPEDDVSQKGPDSFMQAGEKMPEFPLVPASKGFCLSLDKSIEAFKSALKAQNISQNCDCKSCHVKELDQLRIKGNQILFKNL